MIYVFDDNYELDLQRYELRYAGELVKIEPQVFNVLAYLIRHRHRVVSKEELLDQVWPGRVVGEAVLTSRLMAARKAVGDSGRQQRIIQTLHGRGYRFIALVEERDSERPSESVTVEPSLPLLHRSLWQDGFSGPDDPTARDRPLLLADDEDQSGMPTMPGVGQMVGRGAELAQLHRWLQQALTGTRQVVFVTGEAGLGKSTLVEAFVAELGAYGPLWIGAGQCLEHYGAGEAYRPVLEAFGRLCREPEGQELLALLIRQAPTWVVQMPWLVSDVELERLQRRVLGMTRERMLREMAEAIEVLTTAHPLVLILEDLHWSDASTLALVTSLARRQEPARLLLIGTYRPAEALQPNHPLQAVTHELRLHRRCEELPLARLNEAAVGEYLAGRFAGTTLPSGLTPLVYQRTSGNPLFIVNMVNYWLTQGVLVETDAGWMLRQSDEERGWGVPDNLRQLIEKQFDQLTPKEQLVLEAGSVAGVEFSAAAVAAGLAEELVHVEEYCQSLAQRGLLLQPRQPQTWPDGTVAGGYGFAHTFYHEVIYSRVTAARRVQLHRRIGERQEAAYGAQARDHAAALAVHFERGRDYPRAVHYLQYAGENALRRSAYQEATAHLRQGLALLLSLPDTPERVAQELALQMMLGAVVGDLKGPAAPEVADAYTRAWELCQQKNEASRRVPVLLGLGASSIARGQFHLACEQAEHALRLAEQTEDTMSCAYAHMLLGHALFYLGELDAARMRLEQSLALYEPQQHRSRSILLAREDPQVFGLARLASILWYLGYTDQALRRSQAALTLARELGHPYSLTMALIFAAGHHQRRREGHITLMLAEEAMATAHD